MLDLNKTIEKKESITQAIKKIKRDKRKKLFLVIDTETTTEDGKQISMQQGKNLVYDLGLAVCDKKGNILLQGSFLISEIWNNDKLMKSAYYSNKKELYHDKIDKKIIHITEFNKIKNLVRFIVKELEINCISAYNLKFDIGALNYTNFILNGSYNSTFLSFTQCNKLEKVDIWTLCCKAIYIQKGFASFCFENGLISNADNFITNAETGYKYITNDPDFEEEHTGLSDVLIEVKLLAHSYKQNKKIGDTYEWMPWKQLNNFHKKGLRNW